MYLEFNENKDFYSWAELRHLAKALGFPKDVFEKNLPSYYIKDQDGITIKDLIKCCDDRCFYLDLHFTVNMKSAVYNINVFKKSLSLVSSRFLSFNQLQDVRLAFESYENYDNKGMTINERTFLRTLKMCGRVISPKKLMHKVKHLKDSFKEKGRIQLFEFLDLLALCELLDDQVIHDEASSPVEKTWMKLYQVDNFKQLVIPKDKKMWKMLNQRYKDESKFHRPELKSWRFTANPLAADDFRTQVRLSNKQFETLQRNLKNSSKQIKLAKGGFTDYVRPNTAMTNKSMLSRQTRSISPATKSRAASAHTYVSTTVDHHDSVVETKKLKRPKSSPPVVSDATKREFVNRIENVKFDINTEEQRWREYYHENISRHLPNYHDVLKRMKKPRPAPQRKKKICRRQRPSSAFITRIADPTPRLPDQHLEHCDALTLGIGNDKHSKELRSKAAQVRCKSAPVQKSKRKSSARLSSPTRRSHRYSSLLESLMKEYGYVSDDEDEEVEERSERRQTELKETNVEKYSEIAEETKAVEKLECAENKSEGTVKAESSNVTINKVSLTEDKQKSRFHEQFIMSKQEKKSAILELMKNSCFHRTFISQ